MTFEEQRKLLDTLDKMGKLAAELQAVCPKVLVD